MCKRVAHKYPPQKSLEREKVVSTSARWKTQHSNRTGHNLQSKWAKKNNLKKGKSLKAGKVISIDVCYTRSTTPDLGLWLLLNLAIGPPHTRYIQSGHFQCLIHSVTGVVLLLYTSSILQVTQHSLSFPVYRIYKFQ